MAGMLAGVEHARGIRSRHHLFDSNCRDIIRHHQRIDTFSTMDEAALKARRRLEEKLGGLTPSSEKRNKLQTNKSNNSSEERSSKPAKEARKDGDRKVEGSTKSAHLERLNSQREAQICSICLEQVSYGGIHPSSTPPQHLEPWMEAQV